MDKKYQLVAWTKDIADKENGRLFMIPSVESEIREELFEELAKCHREEYGYKGRISSDLAKRMIKACESISRFSILTGNYGTGIRYLFFAAKYCTYKSNVTRAFRNEFARLCTEAVRLAKKHRREDVLLESRPKELLELLSAY